MSQNFSEIANFLWSVADLLRGDYKQADYGKIIMPFALLRRLDCVLESTKDDVLAEYAKGIFAAMQGMMATAVYKAFKHQRMQA
jgi:type I restriction-modification system DNA methylase subunit